MLSGKAKGLLVGLIFLVVVGALLNIAQLFVMAAGLGMVLAAAFVLARRASRGVALECSAPDLVAVGEPFEVRLRVSSPGASAQPRFDVVLDLPDGLEYLEEVSREEGDSWTKASVRLLATCRGLHSFGIPAVAVQDPMGLIQVRVPSARVVTVAAWPAPLDPGKVSRPSSELTGAEAREEGRKGNDGTSIYSVRPWMPGDAVRHVHWPSTARLGKLAVIEFEAESTSSAFAVLDSGCGTDDETLSAFETACAVMSHLVQDAWLRRKRMSVLIGGRIIGNPFGPLGDREKREALAALAAVEATEARLMEDAVREWMRASAGASSVVVVTPRRGEEVQPALGPLAAVRRSVTAILASAPEEQDGGQPEKAPGAVSVFQVRSNELVRA